MPDTAVAWLDRLSALPGVAAARSAAPRLLAVALGLGGLAVGLTVAWVAARGTPAPPEVSLPRAGTGGAGAGPGGGPAGQEASPAAAASYVHAAGAVARPGLYRVHPGGRVADVLDAAGGPTGEADLDQVNLAAKVADGERVYVPRRGEAVPPPTGASRAGGAAGGAPGSGPLDLNTATPDQLDALPGVGPATAQAIVDYRAEHGRFAQVEELLEVRGIGEAKLAALRSSVRV